MKYLIGIDIGTSATKAMLMSEDGAVIAGSAKGYPISCPHNGWAQQNPLHWREAVLTTLADVVKQSHISAENIVGIGLSGQMHGLVLLDENGRPLGDSIIWSDQRTKQQVVEMETFMPREEWLSITANPPIAAWTAAKILWVRQNEPERFSQCKHILLPKDYIRYVLAGQFATDVSDASGTQLLDIKKRCWSKKILSLLHIDESLLPTLHESVENTGHLFPEIAALCGLRADTIVAAGASDNAAAAIGTGAVREGRAFVTIGTSSVIYTHLDQYVLIPDGSLHLCCCAVPGCFHTMGGPQAAGLSFDWFLDNFCPDYKQRELADGTNAHKLADDEIEKIEPGSERLIYLPFLMGERTPHMNPNCRGVFFGLNAIHRKAHFLRAIMEGVGYSLADCHDILAAAGTTVTVLRACGGGSRSKVWRQIIADILACDVTVLEQDEGPAYGAALLAGVAAGLFDDIRTACDQLIKERHTTVHMKENMKRYQTYHAFYDTLYTHIKEDFTALQNL